MPPQGLEPRTSAVSARCSGPDELERRVFGAPPQTRLRPEVTAPRWTLEGTILRPPPCRGGARSAELSVRGGLSRNRTCDTRVFTPVLFQLSYQTTEPPSGVEPAKSRYKGDCRTGGRGVELQRGLEPRLFQLGRLTDYLLSNCSTLPSTFSVAVRTDHIALGDFEAQLLDASRRRASTTDTHRFDFALSVIEVHDVEGVLDTAIHARAPFGFSDDFAQYPTFRHVVGVVMLTILLVVPSFGSTIILVTSGH